LGATKKWLKAVDGVSFDVKKESVFALVGESGCGKSTVARLVLKLLDLTSGRIIFKGKRYLCHQWRRPTKLPQSGADCFPGPLCCPESSDEIVDALSEPFKITI